MIYLDVQSSFLRQSAPIAGCARRERMAGVKTIVLVIALKCGAHPQNLASGSMAELKAHNRLDVLNQIAEAASKGKETDKFHLVLSVSASNDLENRVHEREEWEAAIAQWPRYSQAAQVHLHYREHANENEPATLFLWDAWEYCFRTLGADRVMYIDPVLAWDKISATQQSEFVARLATKLPGDAHLTLFDYEPVLSAKTGPKDVFLKQQIEAEVKETLARRFPGLEQWQPFTALSRVRSEFNIISRELYRAMKEVPMFPFDASLLALLVAWKRGFAVDLGVLGPVPERKTYSEGTRREQLARVEFQLDVLAAAEAAKASVPVPKAVQTVPPASRFRAAYALVEGIPLAPRLEALYQGRLAGKDPLVQLLRPIDQRGEVNAWGGPHLTLLDAMTVKDPGAFARQVKEVCRAFAPPQLTAKDLCIWHEKSLVLRFESPELEQVRAALVQATRPCIERFPLMDEEVQKARWWIEKQGHHRQIDLLQLDEALHRYAEAGSPPLPSSRHFRLGFLVKLVKGLNRAGSGQAPQRERALQHFLRFAEPPWYASSGGLHLTLASGLVDTNASESLIHSLELGLLADTPAYPLSRIAIMAEDPEIPVTVNFFDWLTETPVPEKRSPFKVLEYVSFQSS